MFRGHIGCQTSYHRKFDRIVEEIPVHVRMTQKDKVKGDDSIRIHQNNAIGFFVKVNVNRIWMIFVACFIGYLFKAVSLVSGLPLLSKSRTTTSIFQIQ